MQLNEDLSLKNNGEQHDLNDPPRISKIELAFEDCFVRQKYLKIPFNDMKSRIKNEWGDIIQNSLVLFTQVYQILILLKTYKVVIH